MEIEGIVCTNKTDIENFINKIFKLFNKNTLFT